MVTGVARTIHDVEFKVGGVSKFCVYGVCTGIEDLWGKKFEQASARQSLFGIFNTLVDRREVVSHKSGIVSKILYVYVVFFTCRIVAQISIAIREGKLEEHCVQTHFDEFGAEVLQ